MLLLNHGKKVAKAGTPINLHFNMLLLNHRDDPLVNLDMMYLHFNMLLLNLGIPYLRGCCNLHLHFNMLLLNPQSHGNFKTKSEKFTFQYASIKPCAGLQ